MKFLFIILMNMAWGTLLANPLDDSCDLPADKLPPAPKVEIVMSDCFHIADGPLECWNGVRFRKHEGEYIFSGISIEREQDPKAYLELRTFPDENDMYLGARFTGELAFLEGLKIYSSYSNGNGCGIVSIQKMKHNKERNEMDVTAVPPIR